MLTAFGVKASGPKTTSFSGEALLWESLPGVGATAREDTVCVDVGLTLEMGREVAKRAPAVLVLTHDDADHIGGYRGFAETGLSTLRELWVPFDWGALAFTLAQPALLDESAINAPPVALSEGEMISRLVRARTLSEEEAVFAVVELRDILTRASAQALEVIEILRHDIGLADLLGRILDSDGSYPSKYKHAPDRTAADRALNRAKVLMQILWGASRAGVRVRFFSVDHVSDQRRAWEFAGAPGLATLLNAVEIGTPLYWEEDSIQFVGGLLTLSIQNRRALCTLLWHNGAIDGGVVVWSDSSGEWLTSDEPFEPMSRVSVATAPHHASENPGHDRIWNVMMPHLSGLLLLCAGGHQSQTGVRAEFRRHPESHRRCTRCRHVSLPSRDATKVVAIVQHRSARFLSPRCAR